MLSKKRNIYRLKIKEVSFILTFAIFSIFISCKTANIAAEKNAPNFIFVLVDDQGWNGTSVQMMDGEVHSKSDYHDTPNIEKLANRGMRFSSSYASAPVCSPSRYSIQFGQTPARLRMIRVGMNTNHIDHQTPLTIPKLLKKINPNYRAAHFGKWGIDVEPSVMGYDVSDGITGNKEGGFDYSSNKKQWRNNIADDPKKIFSVTERAINFLEEQAESKRPFFMQVSHYAVHSDITMRQKTLDKYQNKSKGKYQKHEGFAAMTEDLDAGVGLLLDRVKALGLEENTYIIYTSDNGAVPVMPPRPNYKTGSNFPLSRGKWDAMEGGIRVPFIIAGPKIKKGSASNVPITFSDVLPTIVDLAGRKMPLNKELDGGTFKNILTKDGQGHVNRFSKGLIFHVPYENRIALRRAHSAIRMGSYKLIKFYDNNELMLFDVEVDLEEKNNLATALPDQVQIMKIALEMYLSRVKAPKWKPGITWKKKSILTINSFH